MKNVNCKNCKYFFITWDKNFPYGCKALAFKSKQIPSFEVKQSSGFECLKFSPKVQTK